MAEFLTTSGTSHEIENIIIEAKVKLILVSPYLQIPRMLYERLKDVSDKNVDIKIVYGKEELKPNERSSLTDLKNVEFFFLENLHAKCYFNEARMIITSMNLYEFSQKHNREMGVLIDRITDREIYEKAVDETESIIRAAKLSPIKQVDGSPNYRFGKKVDSRREKYKSVTNGYCIRCAVPIDYNPERPYCNNCYSIWSQFGNPDYPENVCHRCGQHEITSMIRPQDHKCYSEWQKEQRNYR